jgi:hypothetical protein
MSKSWYKTARSLVQDKPKNMELAEGFEPPTL